MFAHGGTLDKFIGDSVMATFGTPQPGPRDAAHALACARAMLASLGVWNSERTARGEMALRAGIGLHFGPVVLGDIGDERRLEFAVLGDTVNTASRLEGLTRESRNLVGGKRGAGRSGAGAGRRAGDRGHASPRAHGGAWSHDRMWIVWTLRR